MTLQDKVNLALELGKIEGAKKLASELFSKQDKADWNRVKQEEYDVLFPSTRDETDEEYDNRIGELDYEDENLVIPERGQVSIDYSEDENYISFPDWLNETRVVSEAVEATYDTEGLELTPYVAEVTELVRPYVAPDVTDRVNELLVSKYSMLRAKEYPPMADYLDAIVKADIDAQNDYIAKCLAVKAKYPKV